MRRSASRFLLAIVALLLATAASAQGLGFGELEQRLKLTPAQKVQFDAAAAASKRALFAIGLAALQAKVAIVGELSKARPDPDVILREQEAAVAFVRPSFEEARTEWTKLYGTLSAEQAALAREYVDRQLAILESAAGDFVKRLREQMK